MQRQRRRRRRRRPGRASEQGCQTVGAGRGARRASSVVAWSRQAKWRAHADEKGSSMDQEQRAEGRQASDACRRIRIG